MLYFTRIRTQPLFSIPSGPENRNVRFGDDQIQDFNGDDPPNRVGKDFLSPIPPDVEDDPNDEDYNQQSKKSKGQDVDKAIDFKKNRNQKLSLLTIAVTVACFTLLGLFAFGSVALPILPVAGFGLVETVLGIAGLGFASMLGSIAISATGVSKPLPNKYDKKNLHDGMIPLSKQKELDRQSQNHSRGYSENPQDTTDLGNSRPPTGSANSPEFRHQSVTRAQARGEVGHLGR
jgi:hypothetical protein